MIRYVLPILLLATTATAADVCTGPNCRPSNATAQGVAELQAACGRCQHFGGNSCPEGVGMASTPEAALARCCYSNSGMKVVDQGVAQGRCGRWFACKRYRR